MYDLIIIGGGVTGMAASIYAKRFGLKTVIISENIGGTITLTHLVENYPGFKSLSGQELADHFIEHVKSLDVEIKQETVKDIEKTDSEFEIKTASGEYQAQSIIFATGTVHKTLDAKGVKEFENKGISYCATCDGPFYKGKDVAIIGGSDSAAKEALLLSQYANKVYIIYRRAEIRAEPINKERVKKDPKIEIITNSEIEEVMGKDTVEKVRLKDGKELEVQGVFIEIGRIPQTELAKKLGVELNEKEEIIVDHELKTNIEGFFAAGDNTNEDWKQAVIGVAQGAKAAYGVYQKTLHL